MSVAVTYAANLSVQETLEVNVPAAPSPTVSHTGYNTSKNLNAGTTPPATQVAAFEQALTTGAATIDLTDLPGTNGGTVDGTGLKVQAIKLINPDTNANPITVTFGASSPYLLGGAAFKWILSPGMEILFFGNDATPDVAGGAKHIDLAGTGSQVLKVEIVLG